MAPPARTRTKSLRPENDLRLQLMKLLLAESIEALNRIKKTAATICVEGRRARNDLAGAHAGRRQPPSCGASKELATASAELAAALSVNDPKPAETG
jgi:hypothetical protein